ncbi:MAG: hypothetical protein ABGY95_07360 [Rubritalea sp.]
MALLEKWVTTPFETSYAVIPDEQGQIENALRHSMEVKVDKISFFQLKQP